MTQTARLGVLLLIAYAATAATANGATYYVSPNGNDSHTCAQAQSLSTPKRTLNNATQCLSAGSTLLVRGGTYAESLRLNVPAGTSWTAPVRIAAYADETVWMRPPAGTASVIEFGGAQKYIEFDGINLDGSNCLYNAVKVNYVSPTHTAHHIRVKNADVKGLASTDHVMLILVTGLTADAIGFNEFINLRIYRSANSPSTHRTGAFYVNTSNNLIDGCEMFNLIGQGGQFWNAYKGESDPVHPGVFPNNNILRNSIIHDFVQNTAYSEKGRGWMIAHGDNNQIYNNVVYNVPYTAGGSAGGFYLWKDANSKIYNNTVWNSPTAGIITSADGSTGATIRNNIVYQTGGGTNYINQGTNTIASHNVFGANPMFVNPGAGNLRLQVSSPAVDTGATLTAVQADVVGTPRPQGGAYDVGAYELTSNSLTKPPAAPTNVRVIGN